MKKGIASQKTIDIGHQRKVGGKKVRIREYVWGWPLLGDPCTNYVFKSCGQESSRNVYRESKIARELYVTQEERRVNL